jgi:hypothetical protein
MNRLNMRLCCVLFVAACCPSDHAGRAAAAEPVPSPATNQVQEAGGKPEVSPVETFRKLLAMAPQEFQRVLATYPPEKQGSIVDKVEEYRSMPVEARELKLRVTELRWYLIPLLKAPREQRAGLLKSVPEPYKEWIGARLDEWDIWPLDLKAEVLEYEDLMHYFIGRNTELERQAVFEDLPDKGGAALGTKLAEWRSLPLEQRQQTFGGFRHYFELSDEEQQKVLATLSVEDRQQAERVVNSIEKRSRTEQEAYLASFREFAEMPPAERRKFVSNAERWQKMSPAERQAWRDLVHQMSISAATPTPLPLTAQPTGLPSAARPSTNSTPLRR